MPRSAKPRFICILEPTDTWAVWDEQRNLPGELFNELLVGLSRVEARTACRELNSRPPSIAQGSRHLRSATAIRDGRSRDTKSFKA